MAERAGYTGGERTAPHDAKHPSRLRIQVLGGVGDGSEASEHGRELTES